MSNTKLWAKEITEPGETEHLYKNLDGINLVYEQTTDTGVCELVGWYRPDGWKENSNDDAEG